MYLGGVTEWRSHPRVVPAAPAVPSQVPPKSTNVQVSVQPLALDLL